MTGDSTDLWKCEEALYRIKMLIINIQLPVESVQKKTNIYLGVLIEKGLQRKVTAMFALKPFIFNP